MKVMADRRLIKAWMRSQVCAYVDACGEVNCTLLVEAWDSERSTGESTLDPHHIAWELAVEVAEEYEQKMALTG